MIPFKINVRFERKPLKNKLASLALALGKVSFMLLLLCNATGQITKGTLSNRLMSFSDVRPGRRLTEPVFDVKNGLSVTQCSLLCSSLPACQSFNFRGRATCQLNGNDVYSIGVKNQHLLEDENDAIYYGMTREFVPTCQERGIQMNIADQNARICQIFRKSVDQEWSAWEFQTNTTGDEYFEYNWREVLVLFAHGGNPGEQNSRIIFERLKIVEERKNWNAAKSHCESIGGKLFSNLDGTPAQVNKLASLQNENSFWLGLKLKGGQYERAEGGFIPWGKIRWRSGKPDMTGELHLMLVAGGLNKVDDFYGTSLAAFFCDMIL